VEAFLVCSSALAKKVLVGSKWGNDHSTSFWSWRHFTYFFAQDCFFAWCGRPLRILAGTVLANVILRRMGCRIGKRTLLTEPLQASDWNAVSFGDDCVVAGLLQLHSFENMTLKVKRTEIQNGTSVNFGAHGHGRCGHRARDDTPAFEPGPEGDALAYGYLRGQPRGASGRHSTLDSLHN
jgi:hypothetical protein